jgi:hypothetical protein
MTLDSSSPGVLGMSQGAECALCDELAVDPVPWGRSPWGDGDDWACAECADNWEPTDEQMCPSEPGPSLQEQYVRAWEEKRRLR